MDYTRLNYLHFILESKVKYKHSIWLLGPNNIYICNFKFIVGAINKVLQIILTLLFVSCVKK